MAETGGKHTEYYNGPLVGYSNQEMAVVLGTAVLDILSEHGLEIVWNKHIQKRKENALRS